MTYLITFLEGIITFVSPCLLPMIPIYVTYFAAGEEVHTHRTKPVDWQYRQPYSQGFLPFQQLQ